MFGVAVGLPPRFTGGRVLLFAVGCAVVLSVFGASAVSGVSVGTGAGFDVSATGEALVLLSRFSTGGTRGSGVVASRVLSRVSVSSIGVGSTSGTPGTSTRGMLPGISMLSSGISS